ncbi:MAG: alpha/beta hydrolase [Victivallales bacterium]|nr:alpha/beta hydrolase [Victivallales bacterium]
MLWLLLAVPFAAYILVGILLYIFQPYFIFCPGKTIFLTPGDCGMEYENLMIRDDCGRKIHAWFIKASRPRATVLFCHGNAGTISHRVETAKMYVSLGLDTLLFDYSGYGLSPGKPSEEAIYANAEAAWLYLTGDRGISPESIIAIGRSLGGPVAAKLAKKHSPGICILESTFTSAGDIAALKFPFFPVKFLIRAKFPTQDYVREIKCPLLVVHSRDDEIIPFRMGERIFSGYDGTKEFLTLSGSHNETYFENPEQYLEALDRFISDNILRPV